MDTQNSKANKTIKPQFIRKQKLKDVADIDYGFAFNSDFFNEDGNGLPLVRIRDLKRGFTKTYTTEFFDKRYLVDSGDMLIGMDGEFNLTVWQAGPALLNQRVCRIRAKKSQVREGYLRFFLPVSLKRIEDRTSCVTVKHLSAKVLNEITLPGHSLTEQQALADKFIYIEKATTLAIKNSAYLDNLIKSRFIEMFGDPNNKQCEAFIEDAFFIRDDLRKPLSSKERDAMKTGELYPYYGANGKVDDINQFLTDCDALCFAEDCGSYGPGEPTAYVIRGKAWVNNHAHLLVAKCPHFLEYARTYFTLLNINRFISGTTRAKMTQAQLKKVNIEVPDQAMLREFDSFVSNVDKLRFKTQQQIEKLEMLKESLMQEYFGQ